jgi:cell wall-associated NlpC family hydrolase
MWPNRKHITIWLVLCGFAPSLGSAQTRRTAGAVPGAQARHRGSVTLTPDDGLSVIVAALDSHFHPAGQRDCSHLVHAIYDRAGFSYPYASSSDLYVGNDHFKRVTHPQPGDLVVWSGHVGIVVNPARRAFFSTLGDGPGIDHYDAQYWRQRGPARFYRYLKSGSARAAVPPE